MELQLNEYIVSAPSAVYMFAEYLVSAPNDHQERCTEAIRKDKKLTLCSCTGDLCNASTRLNFNVFIVGFLIIGGMVVWLSLIKNSTFSCLVNIYIYFL